MPPLSGGVSLSVDEFEQLGRSRTDSARTYNLDKRGCLLFSQSVVGHLSAFGELRLWRGEKSVCEGTQFCLAGYLTSSVLVMGLWFLARFGP
jgi:hypothetical protein